MAIDSYTNLIAEPSLAPRHWKEPSSYSECTLHQLSPYIGKLKSTIASDLIREYSRPGELIVDPFCGSGTVPFEAVRNGRKAWSSDINPYSQVLTKGKLSAPSSTKALNQLEVYLKLAKNEPPMDLRRVPLWVRKFFHPETLRETIAFAQVCRRNRHYFMLSCLLGILHHQRPGFLSYPSSHLVPYLRTIRFPKDEYPEMYEFRPIAPRLRAKVMRAYKRQCKLPKPNSWSFRMGSVCNLTYPETFDAIVTSPPYMNALDYSRDNRLRLWFVDPCKQALRDAPDRLNFRAVTKSLAKMVETNLKLRGYCVLVVGEEVSRSYHAAPSRIIAGMFSKSAPNLSLEEIIRDEIPDIRRSRRNGRAVKAEHILVYKKIK